MAAPQTLKVISFGSEDINVQSILVIHGAFSSHAAFIPVARILAEAGYHVLIPDLPAHGSGSSGLIQPFTFETAISLLSDLIRSQGHNGKAHVVGFSLGGYLALSLAADHPEQVERIFCSGGGRDWNWSPIKQTVASWVMYSLSNAPTFVEKWFNNRHQLVEPPELIEDLARWKDKRSLNLFYDVIHELGLFSQGDVLDRVKSPTLLVSASAHDPVDGQRLWRERLMRGGCKVVRAVELQGWPHAWDARDPTLFADSVTAWIQDKPLLDIFENII